MNNYREEIHQSEQVHISTKQLRVSLYAEYEKEYFNKFMKNQFQHLTEAQHNELLKLLIKLKGCSMEHLAPGNRSSILQIKKRM